jgi:hypothetical protein
MREMRESGMREIRDTVRVTTMKTQLTIADADESECMSRRRYHHGYHTMCMERMLCAREIQLVGFTVTKTCFTVT